MRQDRIDLYKRIEVERQSKLLVYITSTRGGLETQIANDILPKFTEHLDKIVIRPIPLFIFDVIQQ